jgi:glycosyltransferase involved in cell wall biosynthesis
VIRPKEVLRTVYLRLLYFPFIGPKPSHFSECWEYPQFESRRGAEKSPRSLVIIYPMNDWHTRRQRPHFLAEALVRRGYECLWLNPNLGREYPGLLARGPILRRLADGIFELHVRLPREPVFHARMLTKRESDRVTAAILWALEQLRPDRTIQLVQLPIWSLTASAIRQQRHAPLIYDCHDFIAGFQGMASEIVASESEVMAEADWVVFSSEWLRDRLSSRNEQLHSKSCVIRNAVQSSMLVSNCSPGDKRDGDARVVYVGAIEDWFDESLVVSAAKKLPHCRFLIAGRIDERRVLSLSVLPNIEFLGEVPHIEVPALLSHARVGLIPFRVSDLTLAANPLKLYEYFSAGIPVVSTPLPEVVAFDDLVYIADNAEDFAVKVEAAVRENSEILRRSRLSVARSETWDHRAESFLKVINSIAGRDRVGTKERVGYS